MLRLDARSGMVALALAAALGGACVGASSVQRSAATCAPRCPTPQPAAASAAAMQLPQTPVVPGAPGQSPAFEPDRVVPVLDDPRLAPVRALVEQETYAKAASALAEVIAASPAPAPEDAQAFRYQLGRLRALAGDPVGAAQAYDTAAAAQVGGPLADYARFAAAELLAKAGQPDAALERARAIAPDLAVVDELDRLVAEALAAKGDVDGAAARWRSYLARGWPASAWVPATLRFARALLNNPTEAHAEEALRLARRVIYEAPAGAGAGEAKEIQEQALGTLPFARRKTFQQPSVDELLTRARALLGSRQDREALAATEALIALPEAQSASAFACAALAVRGEALGRAKRKVEAADAYGVAIDRCPPAQPGVEGSTASPAAPRRVETLYNAGRASMRAERHAEAVARFALLEKEFPEHRLADDARYLGARALLELGDQTQFVQRLTAMPDDYPAGDMVADGLFELALFEMESSSWSGAVMPLSRAMERFPRERAYQAAGRLPYYLARAHIETGSREKGVALLESVVRDYPLSFYMALAYARLAETDPAAAQRALDAAAARDEGEPPAELRSATFAHPAFTRAVALARQGEARLARRELDQLGVGNRTASREVLWASAFLLARAGALSQSHGILRTAMTSPKPDRTELTDWLDHYPVGRWRAEWELAYPRPFAAVVTAEAKRQAIPEALAYAIMREESAFDPRVVSPAQAFGLMQLIVPTAKRMAKPLGLPWGEDALKRPEINIALGCRYLSTLRGEFADNPLLSIPSYNAGGGAPKRWIAERPAQSFDLWVERIPYEETRLYTKRVITSMAAYEFLYTRDQPSEALRAPLPASPAARSALAAAAP